MGTTKVVYSLLCISCDSLLRESDLMLASVRSLVPKCLGLGTAVESCLNVLIIGVDHSCASDTRRSRQLSRRRGDSGVARVIPEARGSSLYLATVLCIIIVFPFDIFVP